jgi:hypothetical protein
MSIIFKYTRQLLFIFLLATHSVAAAKPASICPERMALDVNGSVLKIAYCGNVDIDTVNSHTDRIVVVVHGNNRNADDYFAYAVDAGILAGDSDLTTAIVAPYFLIESDLDKYKLRGDMLFWSSGGWKKGNTSNQSNKHPRPEFVSSFAVMDELIDRLIANNPNASQVVIAGHSAGGQFVNRYTAAGHVENWNPQIPFRYMAANPSSWLYFSPERPLPGSTDVFNVPDSSSCPEYDDYKYGLQGLNSYTSAVGPFQLMMNYQGRNTIYLLGELDNDPNSSSLATDCSAMLQGDHRLQRGEAYFNHVNLLFGSENLVRHRKEVVPGVGHSAADMFASDCGRYFLYDHPVNSICALNVTDPPPAPPVNLTATVTTTGKGKNKLKTVDLNWIDQSDNETGFVIERCLKITGRNQSCIYTELTTTGENITGYSDQPGSSSFKYRVKARNDFGDSAYSNEVSI